MQLVLTPDLFIKFLLYLPYFYFADETVSIYSVYAKLNEFTYIVHSVSCHNTVTGYRTSPPAVNNYKTGQNIR